MYVLTVLADVWILRGSYTAFDGQNVADWNAEDWTLQPLRKILFKLIGFLFRKLSNTWL